MQVAVVTGGSSGIGQSTAFELAKRGVGVILTYNGNAAGGLETARRIEKDGGTAVALPLDVSRSDTFGDFRTAVTHSLVERWNRTSFDFLVNNAGVGQHPVPFEQTTRGTVRPDVADPPQRSILPHPDPPPAARGRRRDREHQ